MNIKIIILLTCVTIGFNVFSQHMSNPYEVKYPKNVDNELNTKEMSMIEEVFADKTTELVLNNSKLLKDIKHILRNRVVIYEETDISKQKRTKRLSEVPLFNNYNTKLERDASFDSSTFNPLKYKLDFFSNGTYVYQIDNTNFFILLISQHRKTVAN